MAAWVNRTELTGSSINQNGTTSHTCTFTAATSGNFLMAIVAGAVTSTTPSGWTLTQSAVGGSGLYVFTKTASSGESSFSTTHNGSNYEIRGVVYEYPAGTVVIGSGTDAAMASTSTTPSVSGLSGSYTRIGARSWNMNQTTSSASTTWTLPAIEDYDVYTPRTGGSTDGVTLSIAYDDNVTGSSYTCSSDTAVSNVSGNSQGVSVALQHQNWVNRTVLSGSSVDQNGTTSHTATFTAATAGNLLVAVIASSASSTTPSGWTLVGSAVGGSGLYVFTKTASSGESSFSTTHNGSNYAMRGVVYEYPAGTTVTGSNTATPQTYTATGPTVSSLTGTYDRFAARSWSLSATNSSSSAAWTLPSYNDYDSYVPDQSSNDGVGLSVATTPDMTGSSFTPSSTFNAVNTAISTGEAVAWALQYTAPGGGGSTAIASWLRF